MNNYFIFLLITIIYLIGIPITYAIVEDPNDKGPYKINDAMFPATLWPIVLLMTILTIIMYPIYWITKQIKNKIKH